MLGRLSASGASRRGVTGGDDGQVDRLERGLGRSGEFRVIHLQRDAGRFEADLEAVQIEADLADDEGDLMPRLLGGDEGIAMLHLVAAAADVFEGGAFGVGGQGFPEDEIQDFLGAQGFQVAEVLGALEDK